MKNVGYVLRDWNRIFEYSIRDVLISLADNRKNNDLLLPKKYFTSFDLSL